MECSKCHANLLWGYPTPEAMKLIEEGKLITCGCIIEEKSRCPVCGALVWECKAEPKIRAEEVRVRGGSIPHPYHSRHTSRNVGLLGVGWYQWTQAQLSN